jgi:hypothetical protein
LGILCKVIGKEGNCVAQSACSLFGIQEQPAEGGSKNMNPMQQLGSVITNARRYTLLNDLCIGCEDNDAQALSSTPLIKTRNNNEY